MFVSIIRKHEKGVVDSIVMKVLKGLFWNVDHHKVRNEGGDDPSGSRYFHIVSRLNGGAREGALKPRMDGVVLVRELAMKVS